MLVSSYIDYKPWFLGKGWELGGLRARFTSQISRVKSVELHLTLPPGQAAHALHDLSIHKDLYQTKIKLKSKIQ